MVGALEEDLAETGPWKEIERHPKLDPFLLAKLGLIRMLTGVRWSDVSRITGKPLASCQRLHATHKRRTSEPGEYAERVARVTQRAARLCHR